MIYINPTFNYLFTLLEISVQVDILATPIIEYPSSIANPLSVRSLLLLLGTTMNDGFVRSRRHKQTNSVLVACDRSLTNACVHQRATLQNRNTPLDNFESFLWKDKNDVPMVSLLGDGVRPDHMPPKPGVQVCQLAGGARVVSVH